MKIMLVPENYDGDNGDVLMGGMTPASEMRGESFFERARNRLLSTAEKVGSMLTGSAFRGERQNDSIDHLDFAVDDVRAEEWNPAGNNMLKPEGEAIAAGAEDYLRQYNKRSEAVTEETPIVTLVSVEFEPSSRWARIGKKLMAMLERNGENIAWHGSMGMMGPDGTPPMPGQKLREEKPDQK